MRGVANKQRKHLKGYYSPEGWENLKRPRGLRKHRVCSYKEHHWDPPCEAPHWARGLCHAHYDRVIRKGKGFVPKNKPSGRPPRRTTTYLQLRIARMIQGLIAVHDDMSPPWEWLTPPK